MSTADFDGKSRSNTYANKCENNKKNKTQFLLSQLQNIIHTDTRNIYYNPHIKPHIDAASVVWDSCSEVHFKKMNSLRRRAGRLILPDPSLSTQQKMSALGILNRPQQLNYNKGVFMHKVLNNNFPNYLAQLRLP